MPNYRDYEALGRGLNSLATGFNNVYGSGKSQAAFNDWLTTHNLNGQTVAGPPQAGDSRTPVGARVGQYVPAANVPSTVAGPSSAIPPLTTAAEIYARPPEQRDMVLNGMPPAALAMNPMARNERAASEGMPMTIQGPSGPPRVYSQASGSANGVAAGPAAPPTSNPATAANPAMSMQLSPQAMMELQKRLAVYGQYGQPYLQAGQGLYNAQLAAAEQEYKRQMAEREFQQQNMKARRDFAMDSAEALMRNKDFMMNPEAMPYMGGWMNDIYAGDFSPSYTIPEQPLPAGVQGPPNPAQEVSMFVPRPEDPDFQYMEGPLMANGTQQILRIDKRTGQVTPVHQTSGIRVPGSGGHGSSGQWDKYEKDPYWKMLHGTRNDYMPQYEELDRAKAELEKVEEVLQNAKSAVSKEGLSDEEKAVINKAKNDAQNKLREGVTVDLPSPFSNKTISRKFNSVAEIKTEQQRVKAKFDSATKKLRRNFGWTPANSSHVVPEGPSSNSSLTNDPLINAFYGG